MQKQIRTQENVFEDDSKAIICSQIDNVQREGVLSIKDEIKLFEASKRNINRNIDISKEVTNETITKERRIKEVHDLFDETKAINKLVKENAEKVKNLGKEQAELLNNLKEKEKNTINNSSVQNTN